MAERLIHILPEQVASQIAAGEVVERPASAVKELIENSLDAGARNLAIEIERGGLGLISVTDDGCGMSREDAILSLRRHATSKIRLASDLVAIRTLGFRGEALASIASVAKMKLQTRRASDPHGIELVVVGGDIREERACGMAAGTRIEVRDLFFNTPARLKFMKTVATEQSAIAEVVQRLALANHSIAFSLAADGRQLFSFPRATSALERVRQAFGGKLATQMLQFSLGRGGLGVSGLAAMSQESFATPRMIFTFVNGRAVRDKLLSRAVTQAYQTLMPRGRHPAVVLFVESQARRGRRQRASDEDRSALQKFRRGVRNRLSRAARSARESDRYAVQSVNRLRLWRRRIRRTKILIRINDAVARDSPNARNRSGRCGWWPTVASSARSSRSATAQSRIPAPPELRTMASPRCARRRCRFTRR